MTEPPRSGLSASVPQAPLVAERYELQAIIGRGGSATVHRAIDHSTGTPVAVKVVPVEDATISDHRFRESELLRAAAHPGLVRMLDTCVDSDATYLVMELVEGGTLRDRIRRGPVPVVELAVVAADAAAALARVHELGIVHRDIKPANLLMPAVPTPGGSVKLADFGIARHIRTTTTRTSGIIGTALYLSPEQAEGKRVGPASDVYSLGLTLIEACTGRAAFSGTDAECLVARILRDPEVPTTLDYGWRSLLTAMTQRDPSARPSAAEVARRVSALALDSDVLLATGPMTVPLPVVGSARPRRPTARVRRGLVVATAAVAVAMVGTLAAASPASAPAVEAVAAAPASSPTASATPSSTPSWAASTRTARPSSGSTTARRTVAATAATTAVERATSSAHRESPAAKPVGPGAAPSAPSQAPAAPPTRDPSAPAANEPDQGHGPQNGTANGNGKAKGNANGNGNGNGKADANGNASGNGNGNASGKGNGNKASKGGP